MAATDIILKAGVAVGVSVVLLLFWAVSLNQLFVKRFHRKTIKSADSLTSLFNQTRRDNWELLRRLVLSYLRRTRGKFSLKRLRQEFSVVWQAYEKGSRELREALRELEGLSEKDEAERLDNTLEPSAEPLS